MGMDINLLKLCLYIFIEKLSKSKYFKRVLNTYLPVHIYELDTEMYVYGFILIEIIEAWNVLKHYLEIKIVNNMNAKKPKLKKSTINKVKMNVLNNMVF